MLQHQTGLQFLVDNSIGIILYKGVEIYIFISSVKLSVSLNSVHSTDINATLD